MGFFGGLSNIVGPILGLGAPVVSGLFAHRGAEMRNENALQIARDAQSFSAQQARQAQEFSAQQYASRYQTTVEDMKAAGLNPAMAYSPGAVGASPSGIPSQGQVASVEDEMSPAIGAFNAARLNSAQVARLNVDSQKTKAEISNVDADTDNKKAQADLIQAQAAQAWSTAQMHSFSSQQINAATDKIREEIKNIPFERERLKIAATELYQSANLKGKQSLTQSQLYEYYRSAAAKLRSEGILTQKDVNAANALDDAGQKSKHIKPIIDIFRSLFPSKH